MASVQLPTTPLSVRRSSRRNISSSAISSPPRMVEKFEVEGATISAKYEGTLPSPPPSKKRKRAPPRSKLTPTAEVAAPVPADAQPLYDSEGIAEPKEDEDGEQSDLTPVPSPSTEAPPKRKGKGKTKSATKKRKTAAEVEGEQGAEGPDGEVKVKKTRKPRAPKPEPVYVIPDVERKETTFKGRLGYACSNTILRNKKPAAESIFCSRTCRIDSIKKNGLEWVKELGRQNVRDLLKLIEWNEANRIRFMRMSSEMFPFASHPVYGYSLEYCADDLKAVGDLAKKYDHRLTTHPGQFTQLGSPKDGVVENAVRDLKYHCEMMDRMGLGKDSVMIIHGGGVYGDKAAALARIKASFTELLPQNVKDRVVLENDEMCYNAEDLLPLCEELDVPLVFDYHHDWIYPSSFPPAEIIRRADAIWKRRGIRPKQHLSEPRPGAVTIMERRAHADRCQALPPDLPDDVDLMIEAKDKEQAVLHLYRIYGLEPVIHESLRPPAEVETLETKGRKSAKKGTGRKKAAKSGVVDEEEEVKGEDPAVSVDEDEGEQEEPVRRVTRARASKRGPKAVTYEGMEGTDGEADVDMNGGGDEGWDEAAAEADTADESFADEGEGVAKHTGKGKKGRRS